MQALHYIQTLPGSIKRTINWLYNWIMADNCRIDAAHATSGNYSRSLFSGFAISVYVIEIAFQQCLTFSTSLFSYFKHYMHIISRTERNAFVWSKDKVNLCKSRCVSTFNSIELAYTKCAANYYR